MKANVMNHQAGQSATKSTGFQMQEVIIVKALETDALEILQLQRLAYSSEAEIYNDYEIAPLIQSLSEMEADIDNQLVLKATLGDWIIGSVRAFAESGSAHIGRLIVHPQFQNRGLGRWLLERIEAEFPAVQRYELFTGDRSQKNLHLYGKLGYRVTRHQSASQKVILVFMEKKR